MGDLLKEAIADAKAVKESAIANAKIALEEAFTPQLKSMLSAKLREEDEDYEDEPIDDEEVGDEEESFEEDEEMGYDDEELEDDAPIDDEELEDEVEEDMPEEGVEEDIDESDEVELDLEAIIKELESEINEDDELDDSDEEFELDDSEDDIEIDESEEEFEIDESLFEEGEDEDDYSEEDYEDDVSESGDVESIKAELEEYKEAVNFLKGKLHEINILNAKLLFTNRIFKEYVLDNNEKVRVVETFDRAQTTREIKLVYSTLVESFSTNRSVKRKNSIKESVSAKSGSTKPKKKIITEEEEVANRFKELAGIL